jgi:hypothetical protein
MQDLTSLPGGRAFQRRFDGSLHRALETAFPDHTWTAWEHAQQDKTSPPDIGMT